MDLSQALRVDGVVVTGPLRPESTQNEPDPRDFVIAGPAGRWTEYQWINSYDVWIEEFEKNWLPKIEPLKGKRRTVCKLVQYKDRSQSIYYKPADVPPHHWVFIPTHEGLGVASFSKGSHTGKSFHNECKPLGHLARKSILIFDGRLYRQEPEVKGAGIIGILLRYD